MPSQRRRPHYLISMNRIQKFAFGGILTAIILSQLPACLSYIYRLSPRTNPMEDFAPVRANFLIYERDENQSASRRSIAIHQSEIPEFITLFANSQRDPFTPKMQCLVDGAVIDSSGRSSSISIYNRRGADISFQLGGTYYCAGRDKALLLFIEDVNKSPSTGASPTNQPASQAASL